MLYSILEGKRVGYILAYLGLLLAHHLLCDPRKLISILGDVVYFLKIFKILKKGIKSNYVS